MRIAVIGAEGKMGKVHSRVLESLGHRVFKYDIVYDGPINYEKMMDTVDAVLVATPTPHHVFPTLLSLSYGRPVLVEKPLSHRLDQAESMVYSSERLKIPLAVGYLGRFNPAFQWIKPFLLSGGDLRIERAGPKPTGNYGGVAVDHASHDIDLLYWTFGKALKVERTYNSEDLAVFQFTAPNLVGSIEAKYLDKDSSSRIRLWEFHGEQDAMADLTNQRGWLAGTHIDVGVEVNQVELQALAWVDQINGLDSDICTGAQGLGALKLTLGGN